MELNWFQGHRQLGNDDDEFWRHYHWNEDYRITEGSRYSKIKVKKSLMDKAIFFKSYLKERGYCVLGPIRTPKFVILLYRKKK